MRNLELKSFHNYNGTMKFYAEFLIFLLLFLVNFRVFFPKTRLRDSIVSISPIAFLLSILTLFSWGFDVFTFSAVILSFFILLTNFHALFRYSQRVYVDTYSIRMKILAILTTILSATAIFITIYFAPVLQNPKDLTVTQTRQNISGTIKGGFLPSKNFEHENGTTYEYSIFPELENRSYAILFLPDRRGNVDAYEPFLRFLAKDGCTVFSADFYTKDCKYLYNFFDNKMFRKFSLITQSLKNPQKYDSQKEFYNYNANLELEALIKLAQKKYGTQCKFFISTDKMQFTAANDIQKKYPDLITGTFDISSIPEYKTTGFGFVEVTEPFLAKILGCSKDKNLMIPRFVAQKTAEEAKKSWNIH